MCKTDLDKQLHFYCDNNCKELNNIVDKILRNYNYSDKEKFYGISLEVLANICMNNSYNEKLKASFDTYLYTSVRNKIYTEIKLSHAEKREANNNTVSIDTPINSEESITIGDTLKNNKSIEETIIFADKVVLYINKLTDIELNIVRMRLNGYTHKKIQDILNLNERKYYKILNNMRTSYQKIA